MVFTPAALRYVFAALAVGSGAVAQLIERFVRNEEVVGLIPICSTNRINPCVTLG